MGNLDLLEEACDKLPHTTRAMFGGHGLFAPNGGMFAGIVDDDQMVLKFEVGTDEHDAFREIGGKPWVYNGEMTMKAWLVVPDALFDDPRELAAWAAKAHRIAPAKKAKRAQKAQKAQRAQKATKGTAKKAPSAKKAKAKKR